MDTIDHVYAIYIKATPDRVWRAITDGDDTVATTTARALIDWRSAHRSPTTYPTVARGRRRSCSSRAGPGRCHGLHAALGSGRWPPNGPAG